MRFILLIFLVLTLMVPTTACSQIELIEAVSTHYAQLHPGLNSYRVQLKTNKIAEMLDRMTGNMPKEMPRPETPELMKFWNRKSGTLIRSNTATAFPYMQQMINRFSQRFAVELGTLFLPLEKAGERASLIKAAAVKSSESEVADSKIHHFEIEFKQPTNLDGTFYGVGLDLPQRKVQKLTLDIDPVSMVLVHMGIEAEGKKALSIEIRHLDIEGNIMPREISITSPDGSIDEKFVTTFAQIEGFQLPVKQERKIRRPGLEEELLVEFFNYELNK